MALGELLDLLYKDAYTIGGHIGALQLEDLGVDQPGTVWLAQAIDWGGWSPGNPEAAALVAAKQDGGTGLQDLLGQAGITLKGIDDTTMEGIAGQLESALSQGLDVRSAGKLVREYLGDGARSELIAQTEMARAMTQATLDQYRQHGVQGKVWLLSDGACELCEENDADGEIPVDSDFTNGDPPVHPNCVCAVAPVVGEVAQPEQDTTAVAAEALRSSPQDWQTTLNAADDSELDTLIQDAHDEAIRYSDRVIDAPDADLDDFQLAALDDYTSDGYEDLNRALRSGELEDGRLPAEFDPDAVALDEDGVFGSYADVAYTIDTTIEQYTTSEPIVVYRGGWPDLGSTEVGMVLQDDAYVSTSLLEDVAAQFGTQPVVAEIHIPAGAHALPLLTTEVDTGEAEILLARGSRFVVDSVDKDAFRVVLRLLV